ncbi:MAG: hypothetical protein EOP83_34645 [Verrucomicrobiaceae bacterium]|nr:MAG: hypothetical protein EOP83_34645 [Verrucomicrobiaceae bacterium]
MAKLVKEFPEDIRRAEAWEYLEVSCDDADAKLKQIKYWMRTRPGLWLICGVWNKYHNSHRVAVAITDPYTAMEFKIRWM